MRRQCVACNDWFDCNSPLVNCCRSCFDKEQSKLLEIQSVVDSKSTLPKDVINPNHYRTGSVECIEGLKSCLTREQYIGLCKGSAIQYLWRADGKDTPLQNYQKAKWYIERLIKLESEDK